MKNNTFTVLPEFRLPGRAADTLSNGQIRKMRKTHGKAYLHGTDLRYAMPYTPSAINRLFPYLKPMEEKAIVAPEMTIPPISTPAPVMDAPAFVPPAKLTFADAEMIRNDKETMSIKEIAVKWNKGETTIRDIVKFKTFKTASVSA